MYPPRCRRSRAVGEISIPLGRIINNEAGVVLDALPKLLLDVVGYFHACLDLDQLLHFATLLSSLRFLTRCFDFAEVFEAGRWQGAVFLHFSRTLGTRSPRAFLRESASVQMVRRGAPSRNRRRRVLPAGLEVLLPLGQAEELPERAGGDEHAVVQIRPPRELGHAEQFVVQLLEFGLEIAQSLQLGALLGGAAGLSLRLGAVGVGGPRCRASVSRSRSRRCRASGHSAGGNRARAYSCRWRWRAASRWAWRRLFE